MKARRLVLAGGGRREKYDSDALRKFAGAVLRTLKSKGVRSIILAPDEPFRSDDFTAAAVEGALLGNFEPNAYKTDPQKDEKQVDWFAVLGGTQSAIDRGRILGESQNFCRSLAEEPGNVMTPTHLSEKAREMAAGQGLECTNNLAKAVQDKLNPPSWDFTRYATRCRRMSGRHIIE